MARKTTAAERAEMDREMVKIAVADIQTSQNASRKVVSFASAAAAPKGSLGPPAHLGMRPKTIVELAAEYESAVNACRLYEESVQDLAEQLAQQQQALEAARARRAEAWQAIESIGGAA